MTAQKLTHWCVAATREIWKLIAYFGNIEAYLSVAEKVNNLNLISCVCVCQQKCAVDMRCFFLQATSQCALQNSSRNNAKPIFDFNSTFKGL
jgi:hypothetical protein